MCVCVCLVLLCYKGESVQFDVTGELMFTNHSIKCMQLRFDIMGDRKGQYPFIMASYR